MSVDTVQPLPTPSMGDLSLTATLGVVPDPTPEERNKNIYLAMKPIVSRLLSETGYTGCVAYPKEKMHAVWEGMNKRAVALGVDPNQTLGSARSYRFGFEAALV